MTERKVNREGAKRNRRTDRNAYETETKRKTNNTERNKELRRHKNDVTEIEKNAKWRIGRSIAQAVSSEIPTVVARVRSQNI